MKHNDCPYCGGSGIDPSFSGEAQYPCKVCFPEHWHNQDVLLKELEEAETKAIDALSRYKFQMFGYWAAIWVHLNRLSGQNRRSPFAPLVIHAKSMKVSA